MNNRLFLYHLSYNVTVIGIFIVFHLKSIINDRKNLERDMSNQNTVRIKQFILFFYTATPL
jgi:hypothetical protein